MKSIFLFEFLLNLYADLTAHFFLNGVVLYTKSGLGMTLHLKNQHYADAE